MEDSAELTGRVVRLHFRCKAAVPIGSFLRVTGSTLWAPGTAATDPADAAPAVGRTEQAGFPTSANEEEVTMMPMQSPVSSLYTSSVEMVTTPEEYPVWRTRKPVVLVIHNGKRNTQHHYYRYLVVSPGGGGHMEIGEKEIETDDEEDVAIVSTSNELIGTTTVMQWEDPWGTLRDPRADTNLMSTASLTSSIAGNSTHVTKDNYRNLPYRTLDIDIKSGKPLLKGGMEDAVRLDHWNAPDDDSFQSYVIRKAIMDDKNRKLQPRLSDANDLSRTDSDMGMADAVGPSGVLRPPLTAKSKNPGLASGQATPPSFPSHNRIFFICFHLPVVVVQSQSTGQWRASWSESILAKTEGSQILSTYEAYWVGTVTTSPPLTNEKDKDEVRQILQEMNCIPIILDPEVRQAHYYGFCKQVLWPAFHNIDLLDLSTCGWLSDQESGSSDWDQSRLDSWWNSFVSVNQEFCNVITSLSRPGDIMWIHDYHLSLLAQQLTQAEIGKYGWKMTRKVFFLHIPFPTSQIFRELECGERILQGMLHADVVGFHAFDHARHFLNAAKRILGLNYESLAGGLIGVSFQGSTVLVTMSNVSIEPRMVDAALMLPSVQQGKDEWQKKHHGRTIIGGLDIGQRLSGVSLKLLAYERLLQDYPSWVNSVVMIQLVLVPGSRKADEAVTTSELRSLVKRIQDKFGPEVIDYVELAGSSIPMDRRLAMWKASDILMSTPIREGLNHWPMEYIHAHKEPEVPGVVITSEFSAISSILNGALRVNPFDIQMTVSTIDKALSMGQEEREGRRYRDIDFVSTSPSDKWVKNVLRDLRDATLRQQSVGSESNSQASTPHGGMTPIRRDAVDSTASFLARESNSVFTPLNLSALKKAYLATKRRVIITDFNGTIVLKEPPGKYLKREILGTSGNKPPQEVIEALSTLCEDPRNLVYVVSGDSSENVLNALGHLPNLGLAVSNGARFSPPLAREESTRRWMTFDLGVDWDDVKRTALPVLAKYTARSNGSFVKLTSLSIGWSYYSCDPEWGSLQAAHLVLELERELRAYDVRFVTLKGIVEIVPRKLNKGLIVRKILRDTTVAHPEGVDFCLCFGDDISDEKMFTSVFSFLAEWGQEDESAVKPGPTVIGDDGTVESAVEAERDTSQDGGTPMQVSNDNGLMYAFTVAVGKKQTHASSYVNDAQEVANALVMLAEGDVPTGGVPVWGRANSSDFFD
jgi:trehalose 6-phosphate synthase/phosphatase